jgi:HAD superfamily hydrolase (TIGR01509 family)
MAEIKAVIYDMDGLLLDTERISLTTFVAACRELGFEPDLAVYYRCIGTTSVRTREIFQEGFGSSFPLDDVYALWRIKYQDELTLKPIPLKDGAVEMLKSVRSRRVPQAVVTSSRINSARLKLTNTGLIEYFDFILGGDQITRGKPDPEIYTTACHKLDIGPACCLALEDSDNGVRSAFGAGLRVIQVPDMLKPCDEVLGLGHSILTSLVEAREVVKSWLE